MHIHILGICGTFMAGIAALAKESGHTVTGCDMQVYPPMSDQLRNMGIDLIEGYGLEQLALNPDCFVIGNVVSRARLPNGEPKFPLMEAILDRGLPYISGPQWLSENILQGRHVLAVSGTHGKTTTSSMLAWILEANGANPGYLIAGVPLNFEKTARLGRPITPEKTAFFVIEADEYDTAFFDKRSKFIHYRPKTLVLNNLEFDHADIFDDLAAIKRQFNHLLRTVASSGELVVNAQDRNLQDLLQMGYWSQLSYFGAEAQQSLPAEAPDHARFSALGSEQSFDVLLNGEKVGHVQWDLTGVHNQQNALAAIAAAAHIGVSPQSAAAALSRFHGVRRRMEKVATINAVTIYDDFAHHPTAIETTLTGLRRTMLDSGRILAVFEPRSNTMKLGTMAAQLPNALHTADKIFAYQKNLGWDVAAALAPLGNKAQTYGDIDALVAAIVEAAQPQDHIVCMSNGSFDGLIFKLQAALNRQAAG